MIDPRTPLELEHDLDVHGISSVLSSLVGVGVGGFRVRVHSKGSIRESVSSVLFSLLVGVGGFGVRVHSKGPMRESTTGR
jgi:hypothetical protein